jgi:hypothetical protein
LIARQTKAPLLFGPGPGQSASKRSDGEIRRRCPVLLRRPLANSSTQLRACAIAINRLSRRDNFIGVLCAGTWTIPFTVDVDLPTPEQRLTDPGAPSSESDGGTGAPRRLGVTCHVIHDGQTRLPGWAYRTRTGESVRALSDWICLATSSQVARAGRRRSFACKLRQWICSTRLWSRISNIRVVDQRDLVRSRMRPVRRSNSRVLVNVTRSDRVRFGIHLNLLCLHRARLQGGRPVAVRKQERRMSAAFASWRSAARSRC